jgi:hypothetical protein
MNKKKTHDKYGKRIVIEPHDLELEGCGVEIQVKGFKGSPEEVDALNTHVYIEKWEGKTRIVVWSSGQQEPTIFVLEPSTEDLSDNDLFECTLCHSVLDIEDSFENPEKELVCEECHRRKL